MQGHLRWTRLSWIFREDLLPARVVLTSAMSSCTCLCPAGILQVAQRSASKAVNAAYQRQKNLTVIFLTEKPMRLVPGSSNANVATFTKAGTWPVSWGTRDPRSVYGPRLPWGGQGCAEAEEKCNFLSPPVPHVFLAAERAG